MAYREARPSAALASWVDCYWMRDGLHEGIERVLPDGCADVIFAVDAASGFVVGTMTSSLVLPASASPRFFGIRFRPGRASLGIGVPLAEITDLRAPLRDARSIDAGLADRVAAAPSFDARIAVVEEVLCRALTSIASNRIIDDAIARLGHLHPVELVADAIGVSRQHLARKFALHVGVTPKMFARVARFRRVLQIARHGHVDWSDVALRSGYFDQSHLIADFRQFTGLSPVPFFLSQRGATA